ncbi:MAG: class I SAM-dependent methyltransferase [Oscillospiraceae bacterium]|nr:class I SAM-dependent methyltransferase [Oscillospiraceae bacterium]
MSFFQNTCKPEGFGGKIMVTTMNIGGHAALAKWGLSHLSLKSNLDILDIGCGGGANVATFLKRCPNGRVTGVDYSEISVEKSKKVNREAIRSGRCEILHEDVRKLSLPDGKFDLATAFETIYFWGDLTPAFSEVRRVLKPNGKFFICNESDGDNPADVKWEQMIQGMKIFKEDEIVASLKQAGFRSVTVNRSQKKHWICFVAEK